MKPNDLWERPDDILTWKANIEARVRDLENAIYGVTVATFSIVGTPDSDFAPTHRYYVEHDYAIQQARISVGIAPSGGAATGTIRAFDDSDTQVDHWDLSISDGTNTDYTPVAGTKVPEHGYFMVEVGSATGFEADWTFQIRMLRLA